MSSREASRTLRGIAGSAGVAVAPAVVVGTGRVGYPRRRIVDHEVDAELQRFDRAVHQARQDLLAVGEQVAQSGGDADILEAYSAMVGDGTLAQLVAALVRDELRCAEWAVAAAIGQLAGQLGSSSDAYLADRARDVEAAGRQLLKALGGRLDPRHRQPVAAPSIIVARDLSPADTAAMSHEPVVALVTEIGSRTSHTAIMARALDIPAVLGVTDALQHIHDGDDLVVDGLAGRVIVHPTEEQREAAEVRAVRYRAFASRLGESRDRPTLTADGTTVRLLANVELAGEAETAREHGAEGIGLYRTEFLYVDRLVPPSEQQQLEAFRQAVESMGGLPVTLRTFDIGGDKFASSFAAPEELNPLLGLRAVRLALSEPAVFTEHLRAMARATALGDVRLMVPFVSSVEELRAVRSLLGQVVEQLRSEDLKCAPRISLGAMIELPAAAVMADAFAREADFLSIGTNDLVQYALGVDRTNRALASMASPFHPAILRLINGVIGAAAPVGCPLSLCGEMAAHPYGALLAVGFGLRELSMEPVAIPQIKATLGRITLREAAQTAQEALQKGTAAEVKELLETRFGARIHDLLTGDLE